MKLKTIAATMLTLGIALAACRDEAGERGGLATGEEVKATFCITASQMPETSTRATDEGTAQDRMIDNVVLFAVGDDGSFRSEYQSITAETPRLEVYLKSGVTYTIHAVCNMKDPAELMGDIQSADELSEAFVTIDSPDGAFAGTYVMYGKLEQLQAMGKEFTIGGQAQPGGEVKLPVTRLGAQFNVTINFDPVSPSDEFEIGSVTVCNVPAGSYLVERGATASPAEHLTLPDNDGDWVYAATDEARDNRYFSAEQSPYRLTLTPREVDFEPSITEGGKAWSVSASPFNLFENRRGKVDESQTDLWPLAGFPTEYRQVFKRGFVEGGSKQDETIAGMQKLINRHASYLRIDGFYHRSAQGGSEGSAPVIPEREYQVTYYVYLGTDNFSDFNVNRNHRYNYTITIHTADEVDTRLDYEGVSGLAVIVPDDILDSHPCSVKALISSVGDWEMSVKDPDRTPWLELSTSPTYRPRKLGSAPADGTAGYHVEGKSGMAGIYIHADEFIPDIDSPAQNDPGLVRTATVKYRLKNGNSAGEFTVRQYAAQMAVLHIRYDVHTMKEVRDTFYVERILEQKNLSWGFAHYWSFATDDLIASGQWDGLSNTRKLYRVATSGDKWNVGPAYVPPTEGETDCLNFVRDHADYSGERLGDVALGYAIGKNRDRDGNGTLEEDEILWYLPAVKELQQLRTALDGGTLTFGSTTDYFHSSTPSAADEAGVTPGFVYYVTMKDGKSGVAWRTRPYNVIACRRRNAEWRGATSGSGSGSVTTRPDWDDEEAIMPKR